jgi:predicted aspartyl protease
VSKAEKHGDDTPGSYSYFPNVINKSKFSEDGADRVSKLLEEVINPQSNEDILSTGVGKDMALVDVSVGNIKCYLILDAGATTNIMSEMFWQKVGKPVLRQEKIDVLVGSGQEQLVKGIAKVDLAIGDQIYPTEFVVVAEWKHALLVGVPWMKSVGLVVNPLPTSNRVLLAEDVAIKPK